MILYLAGAAGGVLLAVWATRLLQAFEPPVPIPGFDIDLNLGVDWRVLLFAIVAALGSGLLFSLVPALRGADRSLTPSLQAGGRGGTGRNRLRSALVGAQMATTVLLLVVAGLFLRALGSLRSVETGWETEGVTVMDFDLELSGYGATDGGVFYETLRERVQQIPGVGAAGFASKLPLGGRSSLGDINVPGVDPPPDRVGFPAYNVTVSPGYFETLGIRLLEGRDFQPEDATLGRVVVINESMAARFWPGESPLGRAFTIGDSDFTVIGVAEDAKYSRLVEDVYNFYYLPASQRYMPQMVLYSRGDLTSAALITAIREAATQIDPDQPLLPARSLDEALEVFFLPQRIAAWVAGLMGFVALLLGAVGVYGITAFSVARRTREIGIRLALGASRGTVIRAMMRTGLVAPTIGMLLGVTIAVAVTRLLGSLLAGVSPLDPVTFGLVLGGLTAIAACAVLVPTKRASAVDPATTLRAE
jgi:predicted permease